MNVTIAQIEALDKALMLMDFEDLPDDKREVLEQAHDALDEIKDAKRAQSKKTADYISERRKADPNYSRPTKKKKKEGMTDLGKFNIRLTKSKMTVLRSVYEKDGKTIAKLYGAYWEVRKTDKGYDTVEDI